MTQDGYFTSDVDAIDEAAFLETLELNHDANTQRIISERGVSLGWRCAEVGAGTGSIAAWLADSVGPDGLVRAIDIDTSRLDQLRARSNVEVRQEDISAHPLHEAAYDLVHARCLLEHVPEADGVIEMLAKSLRPGGWLVVESVDILSLQAADPEHSGSGIFNRVYPQIRDFTSSVSTWDPAYARVMPKAVGALGLAEFGCRASTWLVRGGDPWSVTLAFGAKIAGDALTESGKLTTSEIATCIETLSDPDFWFVGANMLHAWGQAPPSP